MLGISKLWNAVTRLAAALQALSETVEAANGQLRQRLQLEEDSADAIADRSEDTVNGSVKRKGVRS